MTQLSDKRTFLMKHAIPIGFVLLVLGVALPILTHVLYDYLLIMDFDQQGAPNQLLMVEAFLVQMLSLAIGVPTAILGLVLLIVMWIRNIRKM